MKAILLAGGQGKRLIKYTKDIPKNLIKLDEEYSILDIQIEKLRKCGIYDVVIITGYMNDKVENKIKNEFRDMDIKIVENIFYDVTNNLVGLWMAHNHMDEEFIVINGDDIFQASVLKGLIKDTRKKESVMVIDRKDKYDEDDMKVITNGEKVVKVSKDISPSEANGESIGMIKFEKKGISKFVACLDEMAKNRDNRNAFWLKAVQLMIDKHNNLNYYTIDRKDWAEMDFDDDVENVKNRIHEFYGASEKNEKIKKRRVNIPRPLVFHKIKNILKKGATQLLKDLIRMTRLKKEKSKF
jgi:choline kinase